MRVVFTPETRNGSAEDTKEQEEPQNARKMSAAPPRGRVACVQLEPVHGQPDASRAKCDALLDSTPLDGVVLIVLPEMAFTGYLFDAAARVPRDAEQTQRWCVERARRHDCVVVCGAPRHAGNNVYNAQLVARPDGTTTWYDKRHLYDADEAWCTEGANSFQSLGDAIADERLGLGICMDINPYRFTGPGGELASFHRDAGTSILAFSSAWCENHPSDPPSVVRRERGVAPAARQRRTIQGWLRRLEPLENCIFVCADRVGREPLTCLGLGEGDCVFCGASCVLDLATGKVLGALSTTEEGVLVVDLPVRADF